MSQENIKKFGPVLNSIDTNMIMQSSFLESMYNIEAESERRTTSLLTKILNVLDGQKNAMMTNVSRDTIAKEYSFVKSNLKNIFQEQNKESNNRVNQLFTNYSSELLNAMTVNNENLSEMVSKAISTIDNNDLLSIKSSTDNTVSDSSDVTSSLSNVTSDVLSNVSEMSNDTSKNILSLTESLSELGFIQSEQNNDSFNSQEISRLLTERASIGDGEITESYSYQQLIYEENAKQTSLLERLVGIGEQRLENYEDAERRRLLSDPPSNQDGDSQNQDGEDDTENKREKPKLGNIGKWIAGIGALVLAAPFLLGFVEGFFGKKIDDLMGSIGEIVTSYIPETWLDAIKDLNIGESAKTGIALAFSALLFGPIGLLKSAVTAAFMNGLEEITGFEIPDKFQAAFTALMGAPYSFTLTRIATSALMRGALGTLMRGALLNPVVLLAAGISAIAWNIWRRTKEALREAEERNQKLSEIGLDPEASLNGVLRDDSKTDTGVYQDHIMRMNRVNTPTPDSIATEMTVGQAAAVASGATYGQAANIDNVIPSEIEDALANGDTERVKELLKNAQLDIMSREFYAQFSTHLNQLLDQLAELDYPYSPKGLMLSTQIADALALIQQSDSPELTSLYNNTIQKLRKNVFQDITPSDMQSYIQEDLSGSDATSASSIIERLYDFQPKQMSQQPVTVDKSSNVIFPPPPQTEIDRLRRIQGLPPLSSDKEAEDQIYSNVMQEVRDDANVDSFVNSAVSEEEAIQRQRSKLAEDQIYNDTMQKVSGDASVNSFVNSAVSEEEAIQRQRSKLAEDQIYNDTMQEVGGESQTPSIEPNTTEIVGDNTTDQSSTSEISASQKRAASQAAAKLKQAFGVDRSTIINSSTEQLKQMAAEYGGQSWFDTWTKNNVMKYFNTVIEGSPKNAEIVPPTSKDTNLGKKVDQMSNESSAMQSRGAPVIVRGGDNMMRGGDIIKGGDTTIINNTVIESENFRNHIPT